MTRTPFQFGRFLKAYLESQKTTRNCQCEAYSSKTPRNDEKGLFKYPPGLPFIALGAAFSLMCVFQPLHARQYLGEIYQPVQLSFTSRSEYAHPHRDVELWAEFYGPKDSGDTYRIAGFWDGGKTYRVRFAAPDTGLWTFRTFASDTNNTTLHHQTGQIRVVPASGEYPFSKKGWPRVSANGRYFCHADGGPIFLLSDSAWEMTWKSTDEEIEVYIANRKAKGFNCIQVVAMSHIYMHPYGVINQHGEKYALDDDLSFLNPRYFDHLDRIVEQANAAGIVVEIVPLWGRIIEYVGEELGYHPAVKVDEALLMARYLGGRYAGHNVMWIVAGDWRYDEPQQNAFWDQFGRVLQEASGKMHLTSIHTTGYFGSFSFYGENADWLDYHLYSVGHDTLNLGYNWIGAREGYAAKPAKPVRNAETNYEDIPHRFWDITIDSPPPACSACARSRSSVPEHSFRCDRRFQLRRQWCVAVVYRLAAWRFGAATDRPQCIGFSRGVSNERDEKYDGKFRLV